MMTYEAAAHKLEAAGQSHALRFWPRLNDAEREALLASIEALDMSAVAQMRTALALQNGVAAHEEALEPAPVVPARSLRDPAMIARGNAEIRAGRVGVVLVAGGQGSRLGYDGPKGCYSIAPLSGATLFEIHSRKVLARQRGGPSVPFYIMTSDANDAETRRFFEDNRYFGLDPAQVHFFRQGMWPALSDDGRLAMETPARLFMSPDGHGGILRAMRDNGILDDMARRGLTTLFYFQVDNPLVEVADPAFIGIHLERRADVSLKVCAKRDPAEGLGVVVRRNGRDAVVEYTELTEAQKHATGSDGRLRFLFGSVAIHVFSLAFLRRCAGIDLPLHRARKKVPFCDEQGRTVKPAAPNAWKFEKFIFDVVPLAERALHVEFAREDEFSPVKNAEGGDSPESCRRDMTAKFARWLEAAGASVPRGADGQSRFRIEIDPCYAQNASELEARHPKLALTGDLLLR